MTINTPLRTIRAYCLWCCGGSSPEVALCPRERCPLHEYRAGHRPKPGPATRTPVKAIRARCLDCASSSDLAKKCKFRDCPLWLYRTGKTGKKCPWAKGTYKARSVSGTQSSEAIRTIKTSDPTPGSGKQLLPSKRHVAKG